MPAQQIVMRAQEIYGDFVAVQAPREVRKRPVAKIVILIILFIHIFLEFISLVHHLERGIKPMLTPNDGR